MSATVSRVQKRTDREWMLHYERALKRIEASMFAEPAKIAREALETLPRRCARKAPS